MDTAIETEVLTRWNVGETVRIGLLVDVSADGVPTVEYPGGQLGPLPARTVIPSGRPGDTVLLVFERGDPTRPIIIGIVSDRFEKGHPEIVTMAAKEILVQATDEITLSCGESSLTLRKDGKTVVKGREVLSRASRTNRVKGSTVQIN